MRAGTHSAKGTAAAATRRTRALRETNQEVVLQPLVDERALLNLGHALDVIVGPLSAKTGLGGQE